MGVWIYWISDIRQGEWTPAYSTVLLPSQHDAEGPECDDTEMLRSVCQCNPDAHDKNWKNGIAMVFSCERHQ